MCMWTLSHLTLWPNFQPWWKGLKVCQHLSVVWEEIGQHVSVGSLNRSYYYHTIHLNWGWVYTNRALNSVTFLSASFDTHHVNGSIQLGKMPLLNCLLCQKHSTRPYNTTDCIGCGWCGSRPMQVALNRRTLAANNNIQIVIFYRSGYKKDWMRVLFDFSSVVSLLILGYWYWYRYPALPWTEVKL